VNRTALRWPLGLLALACYIGTVVLANWAFNRYGIVDVAFGLAAPAAVYFAGLAFTLRDLTQDALGRVAVLVGIAAGALLSWQVSSGKIAVASGVAFAVSELADFAVYTPLRERDWLGAVLASNAVGLVVDSVLFLWIAVGSFDLLRGQIVGKALMTLVALPVLYVVRRPWARIVEPPQVAAYEVA
jgi:queuosine precursor transporter